MNRTNTPIDLPALLGVMLHKHTLMMWRYPLHLVSSFIVIVAMMMANLLGVLSFIDGGATDNLRQIAQSPLVGVSLYGFILYIFASDALWLVAVHVHKEQLEGTLEALALTSVSQALYQLSRVVFSFGWSALRALFCLAVTWLTLGALPASNLALAGYTALCSLGCIAGFSLCLAAAALHIRSTVQPAAVLIQFLMLSLCAMVFPFGALPAAVRQIARLIPLSYHVDLFRSALIGFPAGFPELAPPLHELAIVTLSGILMPIIGLLAYQWSERHIRQTTGLAIF